MKSKSTVLTVVLIIILMAALSPIAAGAQDGDPPPAEPDGPLSAEPQMPTGPLDPQPAEVSAPDVEPPQPLAPPLSQSFAGPNYQTNINNTGGFMFIPPDPIAAAGMTHTVSVVNVTIEWHTKAAGSQQQSLALRDFFSPTLPISPTSWTFDPKVIYDQHEDRFVVVTLEKIDSGSNPNPPNNKSYIYLAVSDDDDPNGAWHYQVITATRAISPGLEYWFDYPGFAVDEDAIYITGNLYAFATNNYGAGNLWIVDKGAGSGGLYDGGVSATTVMTPTSVGYNITYQPAHVFGATGVPGAGSIGTFLIGYSGLSNGTTESVSIIRIDDPLGTPSLNPSTVSVGDIEDVGGVFSWPPLIDASQLGGATLIEVNDRRALHAVWRNDALWATTTISPNSGTDIGQTTAHWFHFNTANVPTTTMTLTDQGNIGGEDIGTNTFTFFPSVAVDPCGNAGFGFAASRSAMFAAAYYANRYSGDTAGTVQSSALLHAGQAYYERTFGGPRNRWGDYTGMALDPANEATFWVFNQYAWTQGSTDGWNHSGRWATHYGSFPSGIDFGDLPSAYSLTTYSDDGARHCVGSLLLGSSVDGDGDGVEHASAGADTNDDGVARTASVTWSPGGTGSVDITVAGCASPPCYVNAWVDWTDDGDFVDPSEQILTNQSVSNGANPGITFAVPNSPSPACYSGPCVARFRLTSTTGAAATGLEADGEVEDYAWNFGPNIVSVSSASANPGSDAALPGIVVGILILAALAATTWFVRRRRIA